MVAGEVQNLAQETAHATEDISKRIGMIQGDTAETAEAVRAIDEIGHVIDQINDYQASIAGAVEEQSVTVGDMGSSVDEVVAGTSAMTGSINGVADSAETTSASVVQTETASRELAGMGGRLTALVARFRV